MRPFLEAKTHALHQLADVTKYSYNPDVSRLQKLKLKLRQSPRNIRFGELVRVLRALGYAESRSRGSHHVFRPTGAGPSILLVKPHAGRIFCAALDVEKVIGLLEREEIENEE